MSYTLPQNAIPFDWGKYKSGKFTAITKEGYKPKSEDIGYFKNATYPIVYVDKDRAVVNLCTIDGYFFSDGKESPYNLFLIPKTRQIWEVVVTTYSKYEALALNRRYAGSEIREIELPE